MVAERGVTVVAASQDLAEAEHSGTHTAFLRLGALAYAGSIRALGERVRLRKFWIPQGMSSSDFAGRMSAEVSGEEVTWRGKSVVLRFEDGAGFARGTAADLPAGVAEVPVTLEDLYIELARDMGDI
jgi:ABC-type multidrug transport system ATPase subunit